MDCLEALYNDQGLLCIPQGSIYPYGICLGLQGVSYSIKGLASSSAAAFCDETRPASTSNCGISSAWLGREDLPVVLCMVCRPLKQLRPGKCANAFKTVIIGIAAVSRGDRGHPSREGGCSNLILEPAREKRNPTVSTGETIGPWIKTPTAENIAQEATDFAVQTWMQLLTIQPARGDGKATEFSGQVLG